MRKFNFQSQFLKSIAILTSGSILAQIITFAFSPVMTRLFTTEQIGENTLLLTAVSIFGQVVALRYDVAIVTEKKEENIFPIIKLSFALAALISLVISIGYGISFYLDGEPTGAIAFKGFFLFVLLSLTGITNILVSFNNRNKEYKLITKVHVKRNLAKECFMTVGGFLYPHTAVLILSQVVGTIFGVKEQSKSLFEKSGRLSAFKKVSFAQCANMAKEHKKQALFSTPAIFANNFSYSSINIFVESLFGASTLGLYSISYRILGLPLGIVSNNISKVYFEEAARQYNTKGNYRGLFLKISALLLGVSIPFVAVLMVFAPMVCALVFGQEYYAAGLYIRCLAPMFGIRLIVSPLTVGMQISRKQQKELLIQLLFILCSCLGYAAAKVLVFDMMSYLVLLSVAFSGVYLIYYAYLFKISKSNGCTELSEAK